MCLSVVVSKRRVAILLDRLARYFKLFASTDSTFYHEFTSQFAVALFSYMETKKNYREDRVSRKCMSNEPASGPSKRGGNAGHGRSITSDNIRGDNSDHSGDRFS